MIRRPAWLPLFCLLFPGCRPDPGVVVLGTRDLGPLETTDAVRARDGGYSERFGDRTVWLYGDSILSLEGEDGEAWRDNTWSWSTDLDASDGVTGFDEPVDGLGAPVEFFPETAEEAVFNEAHKGDDCEDPCGARRILWPMDAVYDAERDRVLVFYDKIYGEPGEWNFYSIGYGVAVWEAFDEPPSRPEVAPGTEEPTLLFTSEGDNFGAAALAVDDWLYAYACASQGGFGKPCRVGRVPLADVLDRAAWHFWDGDAWVDDPDDGVTIFEGNSQLTVHHNPHLDAYLAVHVDGMTDDLVLRTAPAPEGPWSAQEFAFTAEPDQGDGFVYCGLGHEELAGDGGRLEYVSYYRGTGDWTGEIRLVEVEIDSP